MITMNQTHSKTFHCTYLLHYYPFDTQVIHLKSEGPHPHLPLFKCVDLLCGPADRAVCPEQRGAGARHHGAAHRHRDDPVLHEHLESHLQCSWCLVLYLMTCLNLLFRITFKWSEDGDSVQAEADQRAADHLPPLLSSSSHVLCYFLLQTHLL